MKKLKPILSMVLIVTVFIIGTFSNGCVSAGNGHYTAGVTSNGFLVRVSTSAQTNSPGSTNTWKVFLPVNIGGAIQTLFDSTL